METSPYSHSYSRPSSDGTTELRSSTGRSHPSDGLCAFHSGRLDPVEIGRKGAQAPRATVVELRAEIKRLEAELWKARHTAELEERTPADPERSLAATLALIHAL